MLKYGTGYLSGSRISSLADKYPVLHKPAIYTAADLDRFRLHVRAPNGARGYT